MKRILTLSSLILVVFGLAACGGGSGAPTATQPSAQEVIASALGVAMHDIYYGDSNDNIANPPVWTVGSGAGVTLNLDNQGGLEHTWAIIKQDQEIPVPFMVDEHKDKILWTSGNIQPGTKATETFTAPAPGEYTVICTIAGHYPAMQGKLVVK